MESNGRKACLFIEWEDGGKECTEELWLEDMEPSGGNEEIIKGVFLTDTELATRDAAISPAVWSEEDQAYIVDIAGVSAFGNTPEDALREFMVAMTLVVEAFGDKIKAAEARAAAGMSHQAIMMVLRFVKNATPAKSNFQCGALAAYQNVRDELKKMFATPDTAAHDADTRKEERAKGYAAGVDDMEWFARDTLKANRIPKSRAEISLVADRFFARAKMLKSLAQDKE